MLSDSPHRTSQGSHQKKTVKRRSGWPLGLTPPSKRSGKCEKFRLWLSTLESFIYDSKRNLHKKIIFWQISCLGVWWPKWSNLPKFHKGGPCREQQEGKMTDQNRWLVIPVARNFLVIFLLKDLSHGEIWGWEPFSVKTYCYFGKNCVSSGRFWNYCPFLMYCDSCFADSSTIITFPLSVRRHNRDILPFIHYMMY